MNGGRKPNASPSRHVGPGRDGAPNPASRPAYPDNANGANHGRLAGKAREFQPGAIMSTSRRIASLERKLSTKAFCASCGGEGGPGYAIVSPSGKMGTPKGGCPECGRVSSVKMYGTNSEDVEREPDWVAGV